MSMDIKKPATANRSYILVLKTKGKTKVKPKIFKDDPSTGLT